MAEKAEEAPLAPFGIAIRAAIERSPFENRSRFVEAAKLQPKQLRRYEIGEKSPRIEQLEEWARLLECEVSDLVGIRGELRATLGDMTASATTVVTGPTHPVLEELLREHPELDEAVVQQLRTTYHRGADAEFVRGTFTKAILAAQRAAEGRKPKVEEKGQVAETKVREGARRIPKK